MIWWYFYKTSVYNIYINITNYLLQTLCSLNHVSHWLEVVRSNIQVIMFLHEKKIILVYDSLLWNMNDKFACHAMSQLDISHCLTFQHDGIRRNIDHMLSILSFVNHKIIVSCGFKESLKTTTSGWNASLYMPTFINKHQYHQ